MDRFVLGRSGMKSQLLNRSGDQRTFAVVFDAGDEVLAGLRGFAAEQEIAAASLSAIGAFERATLGYFDLARKDYMRIELDEQIEVLTLAGNIAVSDAERKIHVHVVVGKSDGSAHGGHLLEARVRPTLEVILTESPAPLRRRSDPETGLALLHLDR
jgi:predicted DNA-binding protein with PD1-like motif